MRMRFWAGVGLLAIAAGLLAYRGRIVAWGTRRIEQRRLPTAVKVVSPPSMKLRGAKNENTVILSSMAVFNTAALPAEFNLAVPFTSQAPLGVWDHLHEEACEEAVVMMADAFYSGRELDSHVADDGITAVVDWETRVLGHWEDTTAEETARILREFYGYAKARIVENPTIEMMKREIAQGHLILLPTAGRLLRNPYYSGAGPLYHMLLVRGWSKDGMIITNDPGTKRGEGYLYKPDVLMNAVHDWNNGDVLNGRKVMIVVEK